MENPPRTETLNNTNNIYVSIESESSRASETGKKKEDKMPVCPNCNDIILEPIKTNPAGTLQCPKCEKAFMPKVG